MPLFDLFGRNGRGGRLSRRGRRRASDFGVSLRVEGLEVRLTPAVSPLTAGVAEIVPLVATEGTTTVLLASPNPATFGDSVTLSAAVTPVNTGAGTPTGSVEFFNGATSLGTGTLNASGVGFLTSSTLPRGVNTLTAQYEGDAVFTPGTSDPFTSTITVTTTAALAASSATVALGQPVTFTATLTSSNAGAGTPTGVVTFLRNGASLGTGTLNASGVATLTTSTLPLGGSSVTASYAGENGFLASVSTATTVAIKQTTTTTVTATPTPSAFGQQVTLTATVTGSSGTVVPTGSVQFFNGATSLGTVALNSSGVATFTTTALPTGARVLSAAYLGDTNSTGSPSTPYNQQVNQAQTVTTVTASNVDPVAYEQVILTAAVTLANGAGTPTGSVEFFVGGNSIGTGTLADGRATLITGDFTLGTNTVTAAYLGDANFEGSTSAPLTITAGTSVEQLINQVYLDLFGRPADRSGLDYWRTQLVVGRSVKEVVHRIGSGREALVTSVQQTFEGLLGRSASGREVVRSISPPNSSYVSVEAGILGSSEYFQNRGGGTIDGFLTALYTDVLGIDVPSAARTLLTRELQRGLSRVDLARSLLVSPKGEAATVQKLFQDVLERPASSKEVAQFVALLNDGVRLRRLKLGLLSSEEFSSRFFAGS